MFNSNENVYASQNTINSPSDKGFLKAVVNMNHRLSNKYKYCEKA